MKLVYKVIFYTFIAIYLAYCGEKSGNVEIINNPKNPDVEQIQTKLIRSIPLQFDEEDFTSWTVADEKVYFCNMMQHKITVLKFDGKEHAPRSGQFFLCMNRVRLIAMRYTSPQMMMIVAPVGMFAVKEIAIPLKVKTIPSPIAERIIA